MGPYASAVRLYEDMPEGIFIPELAIGAPDADEIPPAVRRTAGTGIGRPAVDHLIDLVAGSVFPDDRARIALPMGIGVRLNAHIGPHHGLVALNVAVVGKIRHSTSPEK